jgi:iron-sulfur cluster repair protein YtfE (RIC family)
VTEFPSVTAYLSWDHDRLDVLLVEACNLIERGDFGGARSTFATFRSGLTRHIRLEEEILFSEFERRTGMVAGPTQVMRMEHRHIEHALDRMAMALEASDRAIFATAYADLVEVLGPHNEKEEHILYPMTDRALDETERQRLTQKLLDYS